VPIGTSIEGDTLDFALGIPLIVDREVVTEKGRENEGRRK
jgi:hypothetical protein